MNIDELKRTIASGESMTLEFKRSTAKLKSAAETLCGFLNGQGGRVLLGVSDNRRIVGQVVTDNTQQEIANVIKKFEPSANISVDYVNIDDKTVIMLTADFDSRCVPYTFDGRAYERRESTTHLMSQSRYQQLLLNRNVTPISWEKQPTYAFSVDDLDNQEIIKTVKAGIRANHIDPALDIEDIEDILTKLRLLENNQLINAAVVLFAKEPDREYMQCTMRMARFKGVIKGDFIDNEHIFGHAFYLLDEAEKFIRRNTAVSGKVVAGQMQRIDTPEYPYESVREALINSICHRNYAAPGGAITLTIYDNRLEIINTGMLPDGITVEQLKTTHSSHPRNPIITNVFYRRGLIEEMGMGTQKIIEACFNAGMKEPEFFEQAGTFVVRLWSSHYQHLSKDIAVFNHLTTRQKSILALLKDKKLAPQAILNLLGGDITDRTLRRDLQVLQIGGYIDSEGQRGPKTKWFIKPGIKITRT